MTVGDILKQISGIGEKVSLFVSTHFANRGPSHTLLSLLTAADVPGNLA